jgi:hypothetical protein
VAIRHKRTTTSNYAWTSDDLVDGQIGLNLTDGTAHFKKADGSIIAIGTGAGGTQGVQGIQGTTGIIGNQGLQGIQGVSASGSQGIQGIQGITGSQGTTGLQGTEGAQGATGSQGTAGQQGIQGTAGEQGIQGVTGSQGTQGITGNPGQNSSLYEYQARTNIQSGNPGNGNIIWNNSTQTSATELNISHIDGNNDDIDFLLALILPGDVIRLQRQNNSTEYQVWTVSGSITEVPNSYVTVPVTLSTSTHNFSNTQNMIMILRSAGVAGPQGIQGVQGTNANVQGIQGVQGIRGEDGIIGIDGSQGIQGITGEQGVQGITGNQGVQGVQGIQGTNANVQGIQGVQGIKGVGTETVFSLGTTSGTITPNYTNGEIQTITLNGNLTWNAFTSPVAGQTITLIINTNGTSRTLSSTMKFAGGFKTISTSNTTDIITAFYDGTNYWASLNRGFA